MNPQDQDPNAPAASPDVQASYPTTPQQTTPKWQPTPVFDPYTPQPTALKPKKSRKLIVTLAIVVFVLAAAVAGYFVWQSLSHSSDSTITTDTSDIMPGDEATGGDLPGGEGVQVTPGGNDEQ